MMFKLEDNMALSYLVEKIWCAVEVKPCFPLTDVAHFFSVRNDDGAELLLIESLSDLEKEDQPIIQRYLNFKTFCFEIIGLYQVEEDFGVRHFEVKTKQGDRNFQTKLDDWPKKMPNGSFLITDLNGDEYFISSLEFGSKLLASYVE
ncbi:MAG: DUF1854 domain-containing protein [Halobacteriovoraceae bacterium]|nr:DUF1854 domain-containing protein [Halobacteriovoraceae bacterium]